MGIALAITGILSLVIGFICGRASMRMTSPASGAFMLYGPIFSAVVGLVLASVAVLFGAEYIGMLYASLLGGTVAATMISLLRKFGF